MRKIYVLSSIIWAFSGAIGLAGCSKVTTTNTAENSNTAVVSAEERIGLDTRTPLVLYKTLK